MASARRTAIAPMSIPAIAARTPATPMSDPTTVEVDDQARGVGVLVGEESEDTLGHGKSPVPHDAGAEVE